MSKRIRGITIELDGNVGPLSKALEGVNKQSRDLQAELRDVERLLKLDPKNTELLTQQKKLLADAIGVSADRLKTLQTAQEQATKAFAAGKIGEDQYRAIQREVIESTAKLKAMEDQLADINDRFRQASERVGKFGEGLRGAGEAMAPLSMAAGAALGGIAAMTINSAAAADQINMLSKQTGLSTEEIQKFQYAAGRIDVPLEVLTGSMAKLTRNMFATSEQIKMGGDRLTGAALAFDELGISVTNADGSLRGNQDVMAEVITALAAKTNATERDAYAMAIFGKSAQQLNPLILGGADALKEMGLEAEQLGLILSQETLDGLNAVDDELEKTRAQITSTSAVISSEFSTVLLPLLQQFAGIIQDVAARLRGLDEGTAKIILGVLALVAVAAPLLIILGQVAMGISAIIAFVPQVIAAGAAIKTFFLGTATSAGVLVKGVAALKAVFAVLLGPVGLIIAAVALLAAGVYLLIKNWSTVGPFFARLVDRIRTSMSGVVEAITAPFRRARDAVSEITDKIGGFLQRINPFARNSPSLVDNVRAGVRAIQGEYGKLEQMQLPTMSGALAQSGTGRIEHYHGGTITVRGVNNQGELVATIEHTIKDLLYKEGR